MAVLPSPNKAAQTKKPPCGSEKPYFFVQKRNGYAMVIDALERRGWQRLPFEDDSKKEYTMRFVQGRSQTNYVTHQAGQLVNHIPNNDAITTKLGLLETLRSHFGAKFPPPWFPESYRLDQPADGQRLMARHAVLRKAQAAGEPVIWILKPSGENRGKGIRLVSDEAQLRSECSGAGPPQRITPVPSPMGPGGGGAASPPLSPLVPGRQVQGSGVAAARRLGKAVGKATTEDGGNDSSALASTVVAATAKKGGNGGVAATLLPESYARANVAVAQLYLAKPLLSNGRKFDLRMYGLVARASVGKYLCYSYTNGYVRLSLQPYSLADLSDTFAHLTNASVQKHHTNYEAEGAGSLWSLAMLEENLVAKGVCPVGWATSPSGGLQTQAKIIMTAVLGAAASKFQRKNGYFDLLGFDLIVDEDLKVHLLEVNTNPALLLDNAVLEQLLPVVVDGMMHVVLAAHDKETAVVNPRDTFDALNRAVDSSACPEGFELLIDEKRRFEYAAPGAAGKAATPKKFVKADQEALRGAMVCLYAAENPTKVGEVGGLLAKYAGRDEELWDALGKKYGQSAVAKARAEAAGPRKLQRSAAAEAVEAPVAVAKVKEAAGDDWLKKRMGGSVSAMTGGGGNFGDGVCDGGDEGEGSLAEVGAEDEANEATVATYEGFVAGLVALPMAEAEADVEAPGPADAKPTGDAEENAQVPAAVE